MDMQIIKDLFNQVADASEVLGVDKDLRKQIRETLPKLAPMQIGKAGQRNR